MKKFFISLLLAVSSLSTFSQTDPLRDKLNQVFANIDKSQIPTGFLEEYGAAYLPLDVFNGVLTDSNRVNNTTFRLIYATLRSSRILGSNPLPAISTVNSAITNVEQSGSGIPVPMLYADYGYIKPDAITSNLFSVSNNQLFDVPGRTQGPYASRKAFAATPSIGYTYFSSPAFPSSQSLHTVGSAGGWDSAKNTYISCVILFTFMKGNSLISECSQENNPSLLLVADQQLL